MKNNINKFVLVAIVFSMFSGTVAARECTTCKKSSAKVDAVMTKAAVCKRAQSTAELAVNNVRALINGYGNMWYDGSVAQYHVPSTSNTCPLYCAALWIGGTDVNDQLRIAALRFGQDGDDYWPGPLELTTAYVDLEMCNKYDKHFIIRQSDVQILRSMFDYSGSTPTPKEGAFQPENVAQVIKEWPAHDDDNAFVSTYLAPFFDADGDGEYHWENGDYPYYDFDNELCPRTWKANHPGSTLYSAPTMETQKGIVTGGIMSDQVLKGDQTIWWVFNDMGNAHTESDGQPIGLEIRAQAFAFSTNDEINDMTFYSYEIINRSTYTLKDTYFSQWVDPDLGYAYDDYVGCDVKRGLGYCYNGDESDGPGSGSYSGIPPAVGIDFFQGPYMDPDGKDNPKIDIEKMKANFPAALENYRQLDSTGKYVGDRDGKVVYDTFALTEDADMYYPTAWYFKAGDTIGNCAINGVNFGNGIIDDERFGMRRFVYYDNKSSGNNSEPAKATDYYNYLKGKWKDGRRMYYGGDGLDNGVINGLECDFMFPGDSDPLNWGTNGVDPKDKGFDLDSWTEANVGNSPSDRRFMQSAGPFTLKPGAVNYITVGIPFAQAPSGNAWSSVELLRQIDDVCQALFENCFKVLDGPDAPTLVVQELNNEVVLYITYDNPKSNNYGESYAEIDPSIVKSYNYTEVVSNVPGDTTYTHGDTVHTSSTYVNRTHVYDSTDRQYRFEGYQIYQLSSESASISDIEKGDISKARLVAQCDIENYYDAEKTLPIATLVNYSNNSTDGILTGTIKVTGANKGIQHVFRITSDKFATGVNTNLVNNKKYYYICVAYAHNCYKKYSQTDAAYLDGQKTPYLAGRKNEWGGVIEPVVAIPHNPMIENGGTVVNAEFGVSPKITRIEGHGNGGNILKLTQSSIEQLMGAPGVPGLAPGTMVGDTVMQNPCIIDHPVYEENAGPLNVRVVDPLNVKSGSFIINFTGADSTSRWFITNADPTKPVYDTVMKVYSDFVIGRKNEQLFLDLGIAVTIENPIALGTALSIDLKGAKNRMTYYGGFINDASLLSSTLEHDDVHKQWLSGLPDNDNVNYFNWIRSGMQYSSGTVKNFRGENSEITGFEAYLDEDFYKSWYEIKEDNSLRSEDRGIDKNNVFETVVGGLWAPYSLVSNMPYHPGFTYRYYIADENVLDSLRHKYPSKSREYTSSKLTRYLLDNTRNKSINFNDMSQMPSVRIVFTADTSKWTRCPVLEMCDDRTQAEGNARKFHKRIHKSVDKLGRTIDDIPGCTPNVNDPSNPAYIDAEGMGWFPGYAISLSTGERLNIMFGEDSRYVQYNGNDMMWNPVETFIDGTQNYVMGGRHFVYVMNATMQTFVDLNAPSDRPEVAHYMTPSYDGGRWANKMLSSLDRLMEAPADPIGTPKVCRGVVADESAVMTRAVRDSISLLFASTAYVNIPLVSSAFNFKYPGHNASLNDGYASDGIPCDAVVEIHANMPYGKFMSNNNTSARHCGNALLNGDSPRYMFEITPDLATLTGQALNSNNADKSYQETILEAINVVPNPYYSYSTYETLSQLETKVRFVNIPTGSTISIYTVDGTLVRRFGPTAGSATTVDWDLHNHTGLPIAGGMYFVHVQVPEIGERVIKWFGTMRPVDLNSFAF